MEYTKIVAKYAQVEKNENDENIIYIENMDEYVYYIYTNILNKNYPTKQQIIKIKDDMGVFVYDENDTDYIDFINFLDFINLNDEYYLALIKEDHMRDFIYTGKYDNYLYHIMD